MLTLSFLRTQSDKSFSKAEFDKNVGWKIGMKAQASTVIDITNQVKYEKTLVRTGARF